MLDFIVAVLVWVSGSSDASERLRLTAPTYLTGESAVRHLWAARIAGAMTATDPALLLSIGHHESHYEIDTETPESGNRVSCGVMTPIPMASCKQAPTIVDGYMAGAKHLRVDWLNRTATLREALLGYAGGWPLVRACRVGPYIVTRKTGELDLCKTPDVFEWRARAIRGRNASPLAHRRAAT